MKQIPKPKFEKVNHHVVPAFWQRRFSSESDPGPYYLNVLSGQKLSAQEPGEKMSEVYANIIIDEFYQPSDGLEDRLSGFDSKFVKGLDNLIETGVLSEEARGDIAVFLAIQAARYPE
jgi:hypothetical protein